MTPTVTKEILPWDAENTRKPSISFYKELYKGVPEQEMLIDIVADLEAQRHVVSNFEANDGLVYKAHVLERFYNQLLDLKNQQDEIISLYNTHKKNAQKDLEALEKVYEAFKPKTGQLTIRYDSH